MGRSRRAGGALLSGLACAAALLGAAAGPAGAVSLSPTPDPLPNSEVQGGDGDQDGTGMTDWQGLQDSGAVVHSEDLNNPDSSFSKGSENVPDEWVLGSTTDGVTPGKDNIRDAWASVDQPGMNTFLYLAFARDSSTGTTSLSFELNRASRLWTNAQGARIPCRLQDDVQVAYEVSGNTFHVALRRWHTSSTDTVSGCAKTGEFSEFANLTPNVDVQGAFNAGPITSRLPGFYTGTVPALRFGEAALNLASLLRRAFRDSCLAFGSIWMYSRASNQPNSALKDYIAPKPLAVRTCSASGTKFFDSNADGQRQDGERGIPRFLIWADYDDDGVHDAGEPSAVTDDRGEYVIYDIQPPNGTYMLREQLLLSARARDALPVDWRCSFPTDATNGGTGSAPGGQFRCAWGPIDATATPNATGKDFGNWFPARLTLEKEIEPAADPGRFDLLVDGSVVLPAAGDGDSVGVSLPPGTYTVSERTAAGTDPAAYRSTVECRAAAPRRGTRRSGTVFEDVTLAAGAEASCTFRNIRPGARAIAIRKTGPAIAEAGDTLDYTLIVTNPGDVPFPADEVSVADPVCDDPPRLVAKTTPPAADSTEATLDPGDAWTYECSHRTPEAGGTCDLTRVVNTAVVTATAGGTRVQDDDDMSTILLCPDEPSPAPVPPDPPGPTPPRPPDEPGPVVPVGPTPPNAGSAGIATVRFGQRTRRCISSRVPRVNLAGARMSRVRIFVNRRLARTITLATLQSRARPRVTLAQGRFRVAVRVSFELGSGTPPVTLVRTVRICGASTTPALTG